MADDVSTEADGAAAQAADAGASNDADGGQDAGKAGGSETQAATEAGAPLIDVENGDGGDTAELDLGGVKHTVPKAVADHVADLTKAKDEATASNVPEGDYALNVPEDLASQGIEASADDPMYGIATEWARKHNVSQEAFDELAASFYGLRLTEHQADVEWSAGQRKALIEAFSDGGNLSEEKALEAAQDVGKWAVGALGTQVVNNPALLDELKFLTASAGGVLLLKALKEATGDVKTPSDPGGGAVEKKPFYPTMHTQLNG